MYNQIMDQKALQTFVDGFFIFDTNPAYVSDKSILKTKIYELLTPHWLRFRPVEESIKELIQKKIAEFVENDEPIKILNAYGGFKNPRIDSSPHIDWAELMHLSFFTHTLTKIAEIYEPGVALEYSGDAHAAVIVDNIKHERVETYLAEYSQALTCFDNLTPKNFHITHRDFLDFYDLEMMRVEIEKLTLGQDLESKENRELIDKYHARAKSNFVFDGEVDYSQLSDNEKDDLVKMSVIKAYKWYDLDFEKRGDYFAGMISICNITEFPDTYCIRSIRHMPAPPFWQGKGVIQLEKDKISAVILHVDKFLSLESKLELMTVTHPLEKCPTLGQIPLLSIV